MSFRPPLLFLALLVLLAACAGAGNSADNDRHGAFYGGVSGGWTRP